ncbi:MAG: sec-independent protein translocase TatC [Chitinophagaceae bacterium BSSC1]|nr:MAG: sec-independent protein translocase TatC [Chitinophagaceae bacterium BSSC1]
MKLDISNREDLVNLMKAFYTKALVDESIGHYFTQVVQLDMEKHLPRITDFWETVVFDAGKYQGNTLKIHEDLHEKSPFESAHFTRWIDLFKATVDEHFAGENAEKIKSRAISIATVMNLKMVHGGAGLK